MSVTRARVDYPVAIVTRARELRAAGWELRRIVEILDDETGHRPDFTTVQRWVNPEMEVANRAKARRWYWQRRAAAGGTNHGRLGSANHTTIYQEARARALVDRAGLRLTQTALVMDFDYPDQGWTYNRVRYLFERKAAA